MERDNRATHKNVNVLTPVLHYPPVIGGFEVFIENIAERVGKERTYVVLTGKVKDTDRETHNGHLHTYRNASLTELKDYSYSSYWYILGMMPMLFFRSLLLIRKHKINVLHAQGYFSGIVCLALKFFTRVPYVLTIQSADFTIYHSEIKFNAIIKLQAWVERLVYKHASVCHAVSNDLVNHYKNQGREDGVMIPNGVETNLFYPIDDAKKQALREKMGVKSQYVVSCLSRLQEKNGTHDLVEAMHVLSKKRDDVSCVIIGDGVERERIETMIEEYGLQDRVFLLGHVLHDEVGEYIAATDIFCRPSLAEGFGIVYLEAMACDVPAIGTPVGGIDDFLKHQETGLMAEVSNPEHLAIQIERLVDDQELSDRIVRNAREMIAEKYSWDAIARDILALYKQAYR